jgi:hypothetical protein
MRIISLSLSFLAVAILALADLMPSAQAQNVNWIDHSGATTGNSPTINARGSDTNVNLTLKPQGNGNTVVSIGSVGIGTASPASLLQAYNGEIQPGSSGAACASTNAGAIRWSSSVLYICNGTAWSVVVNGNTPAAFAFTNQTGTNTNATISSNAVTLTGFGGTLTATCGTGCTAIARNGSWGGTTLAGFGAGDTIAIQQTSSSSLGTTTNATVTVGSTVSGTWAVTTSSSTPSAFSFTNQTGVSTGYTVSSNAVTLSGFTGSLTANCGSGCTAIALNGVWGGTSYSGFTSGSTIAIRQLASTTTGTTTNATVTVGATTSSTWTVTTASACQAGITIGGTCPDGTIYAGLSPDTNVPMYTTPCDAKKYWNGSSCTACTTGLWSGSGSTCSTTYASTNYVSWNNGTSNWTTTGYTSTTTGKANTAGLVALNDAGAPYDAADYCGTLSAFGHTDWYLPALNELNILYTNRTAIGNFDTTDGTNEIGVSFPGSYWSSSEVYSYSAYYMVMSSGAQNYTTNTTYNTKASGLNNVRCTRR